MKIGSASKALALGAALLTLTLGAVAAGAQSTPEDTPTVEPTPQATPEVESTPSVLPPIPGPIPPYPLRVVNLSIGCNNIALTYPDGTPTGVVVGSVDPPGALFALWRLNAMAPGPLPVPRFEGYAPAAPQASDLPSVSFLEAVFACVSAPATITMPAVTPYPYPVPMPESTLEPSQTPSPEPTVEPQPSESPETETS